CRGNTAIGHGRPAGPARSTQSSRWTRAGSWTSWGLLGQGGAARGRSRRMIQAGAQAQQLGGNGDRDHGGLFAFDARFADRADDPRIAFRRDAACAETMFEFLPFGLRTDQAEIGDVIAPQQLFAQALVER